MNDDALDLDKLLNSNSVAPDDLKDESNPFLRDWMPRTLADALAPRPPRIQYVDRILREASLSIIFGAPGSLKSLLLMDMLACIASGRPWLTPMPGKPSEQQPFTTTPASCLWIDYDNGEDLTAERWQALATTYGLPPTTPLTYFSIAIPWLDLSKPDHAFNLVHLIQKRRAQVVVIDNLGLIKGGASENTDEMQPVMSHLRQIADVTRCAIVLIHHQRKAAAGSEFGAPRKGETLRGYSGIEAACDLILHVDRKPGEDIVTLTPTKVRRSAPFTSVGAMFTYESADDGTLIAARFYAWPTDDPKTTLIKEIRASVLIVVGNNPGSTQARIVEDVADKFAAAGAKKPGRDLIRGVVKQMVDEQVIIVRQGEKSNNQRELHYYKP